MLPIEKALKLKKHIIKAKSLRIKGWIFWNHNNRKKLPLAKIIDLSN